MKSKTNYEKWNYYLQEVQEIESSLPNADANSDSNADAVENAGGVLKRATGGKLKKS